MWRAMPCRASFSPYPRAAASHAAALRPALNVAAAVLYQVLDHGRIGQGGDISQLIHFISGDLAENAPHDLAAPGLGQCRSPLDEVRSRNGSDLFADMLDQLIPQRSVGSTPAFKVT